MRDFIDDCKQQLGVDPDCRCKLFDSSGAEMSDDDLEYMNADEPLFLSRGEDFLRESSLAIYEKVQFLGEGGFGSVWLHINQITRQEVAIKFIETASMECASDIKRVFSEISVLRGLQHPYIVQLVDAFPVQDRICFVMEYCRGGELSQFLREHGPVSEDLVYQTTFQMVDAIRYCHNSKVVHRDLKPQNIIFADETRNTIKIVDFGIAGMFVRGKNEGEMSSGGTLLYMAPEVLAGIDYRANPALDIWSIGCIIYLMLSGRHPFRKDTKKEIVQAVIKGKFRPLPASVSKPWHVLLKGMLRVNPQTRWSLNRIFSHILTHMNHPDAPLTEESEEEEVKEEQKAPNARKTTARSRTVAGKQPGYMNALNRMQNASISPEKPFRT